MRAAAAAADGVELNLRRFARGEFHVIRALQFFESKLNLKLNQDTEFSHFHTKRI